MNTRKRVIEIEEIELHVLRGQYVGGDEEKFCPPCAICWSYDKEKLERKIETLTKWGYGKLWIESTWTDITKHSPLQMAIPYL